MMKEFKGTPGPWEKDRNNTHSGQIATIHGCKGNDWVEVWSPKWPDNESVQEANANLIAAAPELLDLLIELIDIEGPQPGHVMWARKVKSVINKALGIE